MIIVAEIGSNHCGNLESALRHIKVAAECGADAVKFQLFRAESLDSRPNVQERLRPYEVPLEWLPKLHREAHDKGMQFIVTPFAIDLVEPLRGLVDMVKISAYDLTYHALIEEAAKSNVPMILNTAMATEEEVVAARRVIPHRADRIYWLHGVAAYPARVEDYNMAALEKLRWLCPYDKIGVSDHTNGETVAMATAYCGAEMIEKHFRLNFTPNNSPDFSVSAAPQSFKYMVDSVRRVQRLFGSWETAKDGPLECEMELFRTCRRTNERPLRGMEVSNDES